MQSYVQRAKKQAASPDIIQAVRSSGRPRAIPEPIREKMGASLGMDFSSVKIYESPLVGEQGAQAAAMGNEIAFAPGKFNMGSFSGQALPASPPAPSWIRPCCGRWTARRRKPWFMAGCPL